MLFPLKPEKSRATLSAGWCILPNWAVQVCDLSKRAKRSWTTSSEEFFSWSFVVGEIMWNPHLLVVKACQNMLRHVNHHFVAEITTRSTPSVGYNPDSRWSTHNSVGAVSKFDVSYHLPCFFFPSCWLVKKTNYGWFGPSSWATLDSPSRWCQMHSSSPARQGRTNNS